MKITTMPKETLAELLLYLAENERFESVERNLSGGVAVEEVRAAFREIAREIAREASTETRDEIDEIKSGRTLTPRTRKLISYLSPHEEKTLLTAFGLTEK